MSLIVIFLCFALVGVTESACFTQAINGKSYYIHQEKITGYGHGYQLCKDLDSQLLTIDSLADYSAVRNILNAININSEVIGFMTGAARVEDNWAWLERLTVPKIQNEEPNQDFKTKFSTEATYLALNRYAINSLTPLRPVTGIQSQDVYGAICEK